MRKEAGYEVTDRISVTCATDEKLAAIIARGIPTCERKLEGERCTPTSAAVILHFVQRYDA